MGYRSSKYSRTQLYRKILSICSSNAYLSSPCIYIKRQLLTVFKDNSAHDALNAISKLSASDLLQFDMDGGTSLAHSTDDLSSCKVTQCGEMCATGYTAMTRVGVPGSGKNCKRDNFAYVCCPSFSAPDPKTCYWNLQTTGANLFERDCNGGCLEVGDVKVAGDSWGWVGSAFDGAAGPKCGRGGMYHMARQTFSLTEVRRRNILLSRRKQAAVSRYMYLDRVRRHVSRREAFRKSALSLNKVFDQV